MPTLHSLVSRPSSPARKPQQDSKHPLQAFMLVACLAASAAQAQGIYKNVGADGRITFSDRPAAQASRHGASATNAPAPSAADTSAQWPYALRQAASRYPVVLYSAKDCQPCDEARHFLQVRGIPFAEWLVESNADQSALQKLSGRSSLPFATIGKQHLSGFSDSSWSEYLNAAGYPAQSQLPANYRPQPAAPLAAAMQPQPDGKSLKPATATPATPPAFSPPPGTPTTDNPAGLRF